MSTVLEGVQGWKRGARGDDGPPGTHSLPLALDVLGPVTSCLLLVPLLPLSPLVCFPCPHLLLPVSRSLLPSLRTPCFPCPSPDFSVVTVKGVALGGTQEPQGGPAPPVEVGPTTVIQVTESPTFSLRSRPYFPQADTSFCMHGPTDRGVRAEPRVRRDEVPEGPLVVLWPLVTPLSHPLRPSTLQSPPTSPTGPVFSLSRREQGGWNRGNSGLRGPPGTSSLTPLPGHREFRGGGCGVSHRAG